MTKNSHLEAFKNLFFSKADAEEIARSKKDSLILSTAVKYLPKCIETIRKESIDMKFEASVWIQEEKFSSEIGNQIKKILISIGYGTNLVPGPRNGWHLNIFWREMTDEEKNPL